MIKRDDAIDDAIADIRKSADGASSVADRLSCYPLDAYAVRDVEDRAVGLVRDLRRRSSDQGLVDQFLHEFGPSSQEGVALLRLAEARRCCAFRMISTSMPSSPTKSRLPIGNSISANLTRCSSMRRLGAWFLRAGWCSTGSIAAAVSLQNR